MPAARWLGGAGIALSGLGGVLVWPGGGAVTLPLSGVALMTAAAVGWGGLYSLRGRGGGADPLATTAASFLLAVPAGLVIWAVLPDRMFWGGGGAVLAVTSGAMTSGGLGYALWYTVLPGGWGGPRARQWRS